MEFYGSDDSKSSDPTRCSAPINTLLPKSSLSVMVCGPNSGKIRKYVPWISMPYPERSLYTVFNKIQTVCKNNGLPKCIIDYSNNLYKLFNDKSGISRGASHVYIFHVKIMYLEVLKKYQKYLV